MIIRIYSGNGVSDSAVVVIKGDINGDGTTNLTDFNLVTAHLISANLGGMFLLAADVDGDRSVTMADSDLILMHLMGTADLYEDVRVVQSSVPDDTNDQDNTDAQDDGDGNGDAFYKSPLFLAAVAAVIAVFAVAAYIKIKSGKEENDQ